MKLGSICVKFADERVYGELVLGYADTQDGMLVKSSVERTGNRVTYIK